MAHDTNRVEIAPGVELHYQESGSGVPLVCIHGLTGDLGSWGAQVPVFQKSFRTITYSRRFSRPNRNDPRSSPNHSVLVDADDLARLLEALHAEPAILVGSSFGAYTALAMAMAHPHKVRAMVLSEPPVMSWADLVEGGRAVREEFERTITRPARQAFEDGDDDRAAQIYASGVLGPAGIDGIPGAARERRLSNTAAIKPLAMSNREFVGLDPAEARKLRMPILLLSGQNTRPIFSCIFESARRLLSTATALRVPDAGHSIYREQPAVFNQLCLDFLADALAKDPPQRG